MSISAADAIERLKAGNQRYCEDIEGHRNISALDRAALRSGQKPFASVLACADSRVPPELIFDQGLGHLFVIRVAGNIVNEAILGSLEFASMVLGVKLVVVMGHQNCGAVSAAVDHIDAPGPATNSHIDTLIDAIRPAVRAAGGEGDLVDRSIHMNAKMVARQIRESEPVMVKLADEGLVVVSSYYDLESGRVEWLD